MSASCKLPIHVDAARLRAELENLERETVWLSHPDYTVADAGAWTAIAVLSTNGDHTGPESLRYRGGSVATPTEILKRCPYMQEVIGMFRTDIHRGRLMSLVAGKTISEHRDYGAQRYSLERGFIRVHIPIRTHEKVSFYVSGQRLPMEPGEAWYVNVCDPHRVENLSDVNRVHLVLDMKVNDWVLSMFPPLTLAERAKGLGLRLFERDAIRLRDAGKRTYHAARKFAGDLGLRALLRRSA